MPEHGYTHLLIGITINIDIVELSMSRQHKNIAWRMWTFYSSVIGFTNMQNINSLCAGQEILETGRLSAALRLTQKMKQRLPHNY